MKVLVINCGSSSIKYQLLNMENESVMAKGLVERIGIEGSVLNHQPAGCDKIKIFGDMPTHKEGIQFVLDALTSKEHGVIESMNEIDAVGHRVAHGGEYFNGSAVVNEENLAKIKDCIALAPLHNPANVMGIEAVQAILPNAPMVAVFDTAFHQTIPEKAYLYGLPYELYQKHGIRRYGFHGTSHKFVSEVAAEAAGVDLKNSKIITCHLGNGASVTAVKNGESVDTSMGFTPLEGLIMGTRSGDMDPAIVPFLMEKENLSIDEANALLNKKSGVQGISGVSSDFRDLEEAAAAGNNRAQAALDVFNYRVKKYVGEYAAAMNGLDVLVFTAGIGENAPAVRAAVCEGMEYLGVKICPERNNVRGKLTLISTDDSKVKVFVVPTNEELVIGRETERLSK